MSQNFAQYITKSLSIRSHYRTLESDMHGSEWTISEDALAFLTDAGLVGRLVMSLEQRWPKENTIPELRHKIGECMWWLIVLSERSGLNAEDLLSEFLKKTETKFK